MNPVSKLFAVIVTVASFCLSEPVRAADDNIYPVAIFPFVEKGSGLDGYGEKINEILYADLITNERLYLVDREDLKKIIDEMELNVSGMVNPDQMIQVGQLTGAKILVTGSVFEIDGTLVMVAKVIGTETSRLFGASVKGGVDDDVFTFVEQLSVKIADIIETKSSQMIAPEVARADRQKALQQQVAGKTKPSVAVKIAERHINRNAFDPAAETEVTLFLNELGFQVLDWDGVSDTDADVQIKGEGFSEVATRRGNIVSVKARLEIRAIDQKSKQVIAIERQNEVEMDLSEQFAGKKALQEAAASIAERIIPKIVDHYN